MTEDAIIVENLRRTYSNDEHAAVDGLSFRVSEGEIFGILGPNGAGKTTTIKMLCTLLKPSSGRAVVLGTDVSDDRDSARLRKRINVVSGGERGLYYRLTGRQNLRFFSDLYNIPRVIRDERIDQALELVHMKDAADRRVEEYSRGMKQRIHIARSLINDPEILFLDEPSIGLDPEMALEIRDIVRDLAEKGKTIILTTHYMSEAEELCNRILLLKRGKAVGCGTIEQLREIASKESVVRISTTRDPSATVMRLSSEYSIRMEPLPGRFETDVTVEKGRDILPVLEPEFEPYGIRSIRYDDATLEETYLRLTGGD